MSVCLPSVGSGITELCQLIPMPKPVKETDQRINEFVKGGLPPNLVGKNSLTPAEEREALKAKCEALERMLVKAKQNVSGFADVHGLGKYTNEDLLRLIKKRVPSNTYEHIYVTKERHLFNEGEKRSRKIELLRAENFFEEISIMFDLIPAFFSSLFDGESDYRVNVDGDSIADELLAAQKTAEEDLSSEQKDKLSAERLHQIKCAFQQWLSITIWVPENCNCDAEVQLVSSSEILQLTIAPGILLRHLIGRS